MSQIPADGSQIPANGTRVRQGKRHGKIDSTGHYPPWGLRVRVHWADGALSWHRADEIVRDE